MEPIEILETQGLGSEFADAIEKNLPGFFPLFYPRRYVDIGNYHSPRAVAAVCSITTFEANKFGNKARVLSLLLAGGLQSMVEKRMPLLFLHPNLLEALKQTTFQDALKWRTMPLPYESGIIVLPRKGLTCPESGDCQFIFWGRHKAGENVLFPWPSVRPDQYYFDPDDRMKLEQRGALRVVVDSFSLAGICTNSMEWYHSNITEEVGDELRIKDFFNPDRPTYDKDSNLSADDYPFANAIACIGMGVLLALTTRPELLTAGTRIKSLKGQKEGKTTEFWSPNVVGLHYKPQIVGRAGETESHASPRMHWRRGHFKHQPYGPKSSLRKVIWIEPVLVAAETEKKTSIPPSCTSTAPAINTRSDSSAITVL